MNFYLLVEGRRTEAKIYPAWFSYLIPNFKRVKSFSDVTDNCYYLVSGFGYPSVIQDHFPNAVKDIKQVKKFNALVLALDAGESGYERRLKEVNDFAEKEKLIDNSYQLIVIVQNVCIETWLLGNRKIISRASNKSKLKEYLRHYDILKKDPEKMDKYEGYNTKEQFHHDFLAETFKEKGISYNKNNPGDAQKKFYLDEIIKRTKENKDHLESFQKFLEFCKETNNG